MVEQAGSKNLDNLPVAIEQRIGELVARMTLAEKIGQMSQLSGSGGAELKRAVAEGRVGSILNDVNTENINELQRIAREESRLGIPLLVGRDVIHGFRTIFPIPLGQAASWNPAVVREGARIAALEAASTGVNWTFAPMIDVTRDPRWGRIAESLGEDPWLASVLGAAMVQGFQGDDLAGKGTIAACAKHFAGYGATEGGRDYNTANIPENELRNVYLPPFQAAADAGVATFMASFSDLNGVPASGNEFLMKQILRQEWGYKGFVVSDWESIRQLSVHGFTANDKEAAYEAANAGVDMEMVSTTYADHLPALVAEGRIDEREIDRMVTSILRIKARLGLFDNSHTEPTDFPALVNQQHREAARQAARQSVVMLQNRNRVLPLNSGKLNTLALIGPLADDPYEQLGTWIFDGQAEDSVTLLQALRDAVGNKVKVNFARGLVNTRSKSRAEFAEAIALAEAADAVVLALGEEAILSGEAHSRADIRLPGYQQQLIEALAATGKPLILVVMAGRPLTLTDIVDKVDAILYSWHPGTMGGPAIADILLGKHSPSGKLPVTFPNTVGQIPIYYSHKNTGKPPSDDTIAHIDDIDAKAPQTSLGMTSFYLDAGYKPLFPFGFGLSYTEFAYSDIRISSERPHVGSDIQVSALLTNTGKMEAEEIVQLYLRDLVGNVTRPVRELKGFQRVRLQPGEARRVGFTLTSEELAFYNRKMQKVVEPGQFHVWIGGSSEAELATQFELLGETVLLP
ncbi:glycosyl hydrolase [Pseudomaricurvus alcaniphilus]|uniref:glycoside hydrolase family 3 N-terminal domain-containing protein n=1 Tax=Pseudomaricurvus alcaniphilus TaxID=1166482 RepID=UPI001408F70B|nr:glycoside hydrolase family 3 N-terminal domain-containing protein [Pseudomaricurvus alcaniphilus]NHN36938.1 glycosyl hydrolase [Pseudomaricurvus alcaniphilus]